MPHTQKQKCREYKSLHGCTVVKCVQTFTFGKRTGDVWACSLSILRVAGAANFGNEQKYRTWCGVNTSIYPTTTRVDVGGKRLSSYLLY